MAPHDPPPTASPPPPAAASPDRVAFAPPLVDVRYAVDGPVAVITLDRADARNAYSDGMLSGIERTFDRAESDPEVRVIVLAAAGPAFHAGGDLKAMRDRTGMFAGGAAELRRAYLDGIHRVPRQLQRCDKPVIAAIQGPAIGAGLDLACMCDLRVLARGAQLGSTFVKVGLVPGDGGAYFLARTIGFARALELILTARLVDADEALAIGLVHRVVEPGTAEASAIAWARELAALPPVALRLAKRAAYRSFDLGADEALELAATFQGLAQTTDDHVEAVRALLERRPPQFRGT
jgi:enoyl-CoA hydratase/carnithine racemase